jgi:hypothetical protein
MQEEEYYRIKHTPSDTFIEDWGATGIRKVKQFDNHFEDILTYKDLNQFLKSSLQEARQSILEEIEKRRIDSRELEYDENTYNHGYNQALEDIKQLLK